MEEINTIAVRKDPLLQIAECTLTGEWKSIFDVESGQACHCVIPGTDVPLIAKNKGKWAGQMLEKGQKSAHFSIVAGANPQKAVESAIHKFAKLVLAQTKEIRLPQIDESKDWYRKVELALSAVIPVELPSSEIEYYLMEGTKNASTLLRDRFKAHVHRFGDIQLELKLESSEGTIIADAVGYNEGITRVLIEFHFTHPVDAKKASIIEQMNRSCMEVDLSNFVQLTEDGKLNREGMIAGLQGEFGFQRRWIHNAKQERLEDEVLKEVVPKIAYRAKKRLQVYRMERDERSLRQRQELGFSKLQVYSFKNGSAKVYCPDLDGQARSIVDCRNCPFWGKNYFKKKSNEFRRSQPDYLSIYPEEMHVMCGCKQGVKNSKLKALGLSNRKAGKASVSFQEPSKM
jgi:hypothetical protein